VPSPALSPTPAETAQMFDGNPPGPVLTMTELPDSTFVAGAGPVGDVEEGFAWELWRGQGEDWRKLTWPAEAEPLSLHRTPSGDALFAVPFSQATYGPGQAWGLMRSPDLGWSWEQVLSGLGDPYVMQLAFSPGFTTDRRVYAVTWYNGVFWSSDAGDTWAPLPHADEVDPSGGACPYDLTVAVSPDYTASPENGGPAEGMVLASFGRGLHRWLAGADSWQTSPMTVTTPLQDYEPESAPLTARAVAFSPDFTTDKTIYLYSGFSGMFRSVDGGAQWTSINRWLPDPVPLEPRTSLVALSSLEAYVLLPAPAGEEASSSISVLYRTLDGGLTWQALQDPPSWGYVSAFHLSVAADGEATLHLGGSQGGVVSSTIDALTWD
jgi:hypothetical protein